MINTTGFTNKIQKSNGRHSQSTPLYSYCYLMTIFTNIAILPFTFKDYDKQKDTLKKIVGTNPDAPQGAA